MTFNTRDLPNVSFESSTLERINQRYNNWDGNFKFRSSMMREVFNAIYLANPTWRFELEGLMYVDTVAATPKTIKVSCEGEVLGSIEADYFRGNYGVCIVNHRVNNHKMRTSNDKRAVSAIKKYFVKRNVNERLMKAESDADDAISSAINRSNHSKQSVKYKLESECFKFVMDHARETFEQFSKAHAPANLTMLEKYDKEFLDADTIEEVRSKYGAGNASLVVLDQGKYIVKTGDNVQLFDDNDLPEQIRGRLGLLKLVEYRQMVTNAGCRVSSEVFIVVLDVEGASE
jgi:uncharacterized protein with FMN-binding domain